MSILFFKKLITLRKKDLKFVEEEIILSEKQYC